MSLGEPTGADFEEFLLMASLIVKDDTREAWESFINFEKRVRSATELFLTQTGRVIGLTSQTLLYDTPKNQVIDLGLDVRSVSAMSIFGTVLVQGQDYYLRPYDAPQRDRPYNRILMASPYQYIATPFNRRDIQSISVTALVGSWAVMPSPMRDAILAKVAATAAPQLSLAISQGLLTWTSPEGRREEYAHYANQIPLANERKMWLDDFQEGVNTYKRVTGGGFR